MENKIPIPNEEEKIIINKELSFNNNIFNLSVHKIDDERIKFIIPSKNTEEFKKYQVELTLEKLKQINKFFKMFDTLDEFEIELINIVKENDIKIIEYTKNEIILNIKIFARNNNIVQIKLPKVEMNEKEKLKILSDKYIIANNIKKKNDEKIKELENLFTNLLKQLELKDKKIKNLEDDLIESKSNINKIKEKDILIEKYKYQMKILNKEIQINNYYIHKNNKNINLVDFYDVIIDIKSIKDICKGLEIKMKEEGEYNYNKYKNIETIKIGTIGNINKGKTFILSKLSKIILPDGIETKGISVKYPELEGDKENKIVLIDSMGLNGAILKREKDDKFNENKKEEIDIKKLLKEKLLTEIFLIQINFPKR